MLQKLLLYSWLATAIVCIAVLVLFYQHLDTKSIGLLMVSIAISIAMYQFRKQANQPPPNS